MLKHRIHILLFLISCLLSQAAAQLQHHPLTPEVYNILHQSSNTLIRLSFSPRLLQRNAEENRWEGNFNLIISARDVNHLHLVLERQYPVRFAYDEDEQEDLAPLMHRQYYLGLPPGSYILQFELQDAATGNTYFTERYYVADDLKDGGISDVLLSHVPAEKLEALVPLGTSKIPSGTESVSWYAELYGKRGDIFTVRTVLYRKDPQSAGMAEHFATLDQINDVASLKSSERHVLSGSFVTRDLESGEYLVEIYIYRDDELYAEENASFAIEWEALPQVYAHLDRSIRMMEAVFPSSLTDSLLNIKVYDRRLLAFSEFWQMRNQVDPLGLERFYKRAFYAEANYTEAGSPGYLSDRGRIYINFGKPDVETSATSGKKELLIWEYRKWQLKFVFVRNNASFQLVSENNFVRI